MDDTVASSLPPNMVEALRKELDPGEDVRWCGQPDPRIIFRRLIPIVLVMACLLGAFCAWAGLTGYSTLQQLRGLEPILGPSQTPPSYGSVYFAFGSAAFLSAVLVQTIAIPWMTAAGARRTVYAVTRTRVLKIALSRRGVAKVNAVEPGHPFHLRRDGLKSQKGDIHLYPGSRVNGGTMLSLEAIDDARNVERLIRQCFDP